MITAEDFKRWEQKAKKMSVAELEYAIADCISCIRLKIEEEKYSDEASTYRQELLRRQK